jgi:catechol 2,3-dioxygenase-like lactoylglutathione lyase family enzyme
VIDVQRVDYIRIPVTDMEKANQFYGEVLGLERNPNSPGEDWVEYETGNVTLAVMTPHTHDYEFTPLPACRSTRCGIRVSATAPGSAIRPETRSSSTTATPLMGRADALAVYSGLSLGPACGSVEQKLAQAA